MSELRLLKVIVQPVFVLFDDDGGASEVVPQAITVSSAEWPTFATGAFEEATRSLRAEFEQPPPPHLHSRANPRER
jgi:hypothetical protein